ELESPFQAGDGVDEAGDDRIRAPMPGRVVLVRSAAGDSVEEGQEVLVMEAMKMELALRAPRAGTIAEILAAEGEFVEADAVLAVLEPGPAADACARCPRPAGSSRWARATGCRTRRRSCPPPPRSWSSTGSRPRGRRRTGPTAPRVAG